MGGFRRTRGALADLVVGLLEGISFVIDRRRFRVSGVAKNQCCWRFEEWVFPSSRKESGCCPIDTSYGASHGL